MANRAIPYGDAVLVNTPKIDQVSNQMYAQHLERQTQQERDARQLDQQMAKEFANVRSIDSPLIMDSWNKYREIRKRQLFDPQTKRDVEKYNELDNQASEALADVYHKTKKSIEFQNFYKTLGAASKTHPNYYQPNVGSMLSRLQNTPMDEIDNNHPELGDEDTYKWQDRVNWQKVMTNAEGKSNYLDYTENVKDPSGLQQTTTKFKAAANPAQFKDNLIMGVANEPTAVQSASNILSHFTPDQIQNINREYYSENPTKWQQMTGQDKPINVEPRNPDNPVEAYASLAAKLRFIQGKPAAEQGVPHPVTAAVKELDQANKEKNMAIQFDYNKTLTNLRSRNALSNDRANAEIKQNWNYLDDQQKDQVVDTDINRQVEIAKQGKPVEYEKVGGGKVKGYVLPTQSKLSNELTMQQGIHTLKPSETLVSEDGKTFIGIHKHADDDGNVKVDIVEKNLEPMKKVYKENYVKGKVYAPVNNTPGSPTPAPKPKGKKSVPGL